MCFKHNVNIKTMEIGTGVEAEQGLEGRGFFLTQFHSNAARLQPLERSLRISYEQKHVRKYVPGSGI